MVTMERRTGETRVTVEVDLAGPGTADVSIGEAAASGVDARIPPAFLSHVLGTLAKHGGFHIRVEAEGDLEHHLVEDVAITLGQALRSAVDVGRIRRMGHAIVPFDEALCLAAVDLVDRPYYQGDLDVVHPLWGHWFRSLAHEARVTLHLRTMAGSDPHHIVEGHAKALARALRMALEPSEDHPSTKGSVELREDPA